MGSIYGHGDRVVTVDLRIRPTGARAAAITQPISHHHHHLLPCADGHISRNAFSVAGCGGTLDCELNVDDLQQYITPKGQQQQQSNLFGWRREGEEWLGAYTPPSQLRSSTQPQFQQQSMASSSYMQGQPAQTATTSSFQQNKNYPTTATAGQRAGQVSF